MYRLLFVFLILAGCDQSAPTTKRNDISEQYARTRRALLSKRPIQTEGIIPAPFEGPLEAQEAHPVVTGVPSVRGKKTTEVYILVKIECPQCRHSFEAKVLEE